MDIERAIQKQRHALLRLSAGWLAIVAFLCAAPISPVWSRWVRVFLASVIWRAEAAAQCLVIVQARLIAGAHGAENRRFCRALETLSARDACREDPPSLAELRARLLAPRCLLENLPRRGLRLLRRMAGHIAAPSGLAGPASPRIEHPLATHQCGPSVLLHPPEPGLISQRCG